MQMKVQKLMFAKWDETLAMDFTHGTNNLGYHLGSLVVTTATGRGFPVFDFICLNEQAVTISTVLKNCKEKNPGWFTPLHIGKISTLDAYETGYDVLNKFCKYNKRQGFFAYFDKIWNSCRDMGSTLARGSYVTAGNTTTNRVEFNWNQVKMLLGLKTRIDKTVAEILQHQMTITQHIVSDIEKQHSTSGIPKTVPRFLRAVAARLSSYVLEKVKKECERYCNFLAAATCDKSSTRFGFESVLFEPCIQVPRCRLDLLIHERWTTFAALKIKEDLATAADTLWPIVRMSQLRLLDDDDEEKTTAKSDALKQVAYIRLRLQERANLVVLSLAEQYTYAKAMLEPLLEHLSNLSTSDFYQELV
ncbi:hypothetical protein PC111_g4178 [Phytophthora cactorum]|nr:hypothetical protein PC111_g4178 [Phytophthora cactorum]